MRKLLLLCSMVLAGFAAGAQCAASFSSATAPLNNSLLRVQFTNTSSWGLPFLGQIKLATIYYGDGNNASIGTSSPSHVYPSPGTYTVSLKIISKDSASGLTICTDSIAQPVTITYTSCGTTIGVFGTGASRTFTATTPAGSTGATYTWNFGDGSPTTTGTPAFHTYAASGVYTVTLTTTKGTCTYVNVMSIGVYIPPAPLNCSSLSASFNTSVSANTLTTTNTSSTVSSLYKMDAVWSYGDGTTASVVNPLPHVYTATGLYPVKLVMTWHDSLFTTQCKDSVTHNVGITSIAPPPNIISGTVSYDLTFGTNYFKVYLIKFDSATNLLYAVDSQITANTALAYYSFAGKAAGSYRTKATVYLGSTSGTGIIPTYHDSSSYWISAKVINHTGFSTINKNIYMTSGTLGTGPGFIGGNVSLGANKGAAGGVSNMLILLRNSNLKIVLGTYTDANGNYSFPNIPLGAYSVYPEEMNYNTTPVTPVVLTTSVAENHNVDFNQDLAKRSIAPRSSSLGIAINRSSDGIYVFPNPASNVVTISWHGQADAARFTITSITGNVVARSPLVNGRAGSVDMNISGLAQGVYFVHGTGTLAGSISKLIIR